MKVKLITGEFCSRCHMIAPLLQRYADKEGYELEIKDVKEATEEEIEGASMLPVIWFGDEKKEYDDALKIVME